MKTLYFVRHGETEWNAVARMQGQWNSDLNDRGRRQADAHGRLLADCALEALIASPLDRTRQTAAAIQRHVPLDVRYDDRIKEWDCGDWSGELYADIRARWPEAWAALEADRFNYRGPNCENYPDMIARAAPFLDDLLAQAQRRVAVVSHGMIGRVMIGILMGFDAAQMLAVQQPNDVVYRVILGAGDAAPELSHFVAGAGPTPGPLPRAPA